MKDHEAKRIILGNLVRLQKFKKFTKDELISLFHSALESRPMYSKLIYNFFNVPY